MNRIHETLQMGAGSLPRCFTCGRSGFCICEGCTTCTGPKRRPNQAKADSGVSEDGLKRLLEELGL